MYLMHVRIHTYMHAHTHVCILHLQVTIIMYTCQPHLHGTLHRAHIVNIIVEQTSNCNMLRLTILRNHVSVCLCVGAL